MASLVRTALTRHRPLTIALLAAAAVHLLIAAALWNSNPAYFGHYRAQFHPDAQHYMVLAENVWEGRGFSRMSEPPYQPDALRTPGYIAVAGPLWLMAHAVWPLYVFNILCHLLTAILVFLLARRFTGGAAAVAAACCYALDVTLISMNFETMSEPLFFLLAVGGILAFTAAFQRLLEPPTAKPTTGKPATEKKWAVAAGMGGAGALLGLAILVRPAGLYIPVVLAMGSALALRKRGEILPWLKTGAVFLASVLVLVLPWMARNQHTFGFFKLSTVDAMNMVYYAGAGPYQLKYGLSLQQAQQRISSEYGLSTNFEHHNPWLTGKSIKELDSELRAATRPVLFRDVPRLAISSCIGVAKAGLASTAPILVEMAGGSWIPPGMSTLAHGRIGAFASELGKNPGWVVLAFLAQLIQVMALWPLFLAGIAALLVGLFRNGRMASIPLMLCLYFAATMGAGGMDATARFRANLLPLAYIIAAHGGMTLYRRFRRREG